MITIVIWVELIMQIDCVKPTVLYRSKVDIMDIVFGKSYIVYESSNPEDKVTLLEFRWGVSLGLMNYGMSKQVMRTKSSANGSRTPSP
ncbi:hypothetical protein JTB14_002633 [Gonioctena quinquepunctata]|nr:hypothetical protein JTB14_002633 [Gonioctena quinquepunctata]